MAQIFSDDWGAMVSYVVIDVENVAVPGDCHLPPGLPIPVFNHDINRGVSGRSGPLWDKVAASLIYLLGHDPEHPHAAEYGELLRALNPDVETDLIGMGTAAGQAGDMERSLWHLRAAAVVAPQRVEAHYNLGVCALQVAAEAWREGDQARSAALLGLADEALAAAIALDPQMALAHYNRAFVHHNQGRREAALAALERALELDLEPGERERAAELRRELLEWDEG